MSHSASPSFAPLDILSGGHQHHPHPSPLQQQHQPQLLPLPSSVASSSSASETPKTGKSQSRRDSTKVKLEGGGSVSIGSGASESSKKSKGKGKEGEDGEHKEKRKRVHYSCSECHRRKQKCNRQQPCDQCIARKVPHLCRSFVNGVDDPFEMEADMRARLDTLTTAVNRIEGLLAKHLTAPRPAPAAHGTGKASAAGSTPPGARPLEEEDDDESEVEEGEEGREGRLDKGRWFGASAMTSVSNNSLSSLKLPPIGVPSPLAPNVPRGNETTFERVQRLLTASGITLKTFHTVLSALPTKKLQDGLVSVYFNEIDWRYPLFSPRFYRQYTTLHASLLLGPQHVTPASIRFMPLLLIVLAISALTAPDSLVGDADNRRSMHERFYGASRRASNLAGAMQEEDLESVLWGLLTARYLILVRRASEGFVPLGAAIHSAQALGLHRDPSMLRLANPVDSELRRRVYAYIYHQDRMSSLLLGRPLAINDADVDTEPPANLDDADLEAGVTLGKPLTTPTIMTYTILRHSLAQLMGHIQTAAFGLRPPPYHVILQLDQELMAWKEQLPPHFQLENADKALDATLPYISTHRYFLSTEFHFVRITLHRPYLILGKSHSHRYRSSRTAAIESAKADLVARKEYQDSTVGRPKSLSAGQYRIMTSLMVLGIALVLNPLGEETSELRKFLDNYTTGVDEATVKELAVLELFKRGAAEKGTSTLSRPGSPDGSGPPAKRRRQSENTHSSNPSLFGTQPPSRRSSMSATPLALNSQSNPVDLLLGFGGSNGNGSGANNNNNSSSTGGSAIVDAPSFASGATATASLNPSFPLGAQSWPSFGSIGDANASNAVVSAPSFTLPAASSASQQQDLFGDAAQTLLNGWLDVNSLTTSTTPPGGLGEESTEREMNFWQQLVSTLQSSS